MKLLLSLCLAIIIFGDSSTSHPSNISEDQSSLRDPIPSTHAQDSLIKIGTGLHDQGKYGEAIAIYQRVLKENPSHVVALYELSFSLFANKDYQAVIHYSEEGAKYKSKILPMFYLNIGSALDDQGKSDEAIATYRKGIELDPNTHILPYNLGLSYFRAQMLDSARAQFQRSLVLKPSHSGSNLGLAMTYEAMGKPIPRLLALSRFLILEPTTERSADALKKLQKVLTEAVSADESTPRNITITITPDSDAVDGYMTALGLSLGMKRAAQVTDTVKGKTELQGIVNSFQHFFQVMLELNEKDPSSGFCWKYYAPYFIDMQRRGLTEAFVYLISRSSRSKEVDAWLNSHAEKAKEFFAWNKKYEW